MRFTVNELEPVSGIYQINNIANGRSYIGQSVDVMERFKKHIRDLRNGTHRRREMQLDWNNYGENSFVFCIVEVCMSDNITLQSKERELIFDRDMSGIDLYLSKRDRGTLELVKSNQDYMRRWFDLTLSSRVVQTDLGAKANRQAP